MSRSTISTFELFEKFPDVESARKYLEGRLSENGASCPRSKARENVTRRKDGFYRCNPYKLVLRVSSKDDFIDGSLGAIQIFARLYILRASRLNTAAVNQGRVFPITIGQPESFEGHEAPFRSTRRTVIGGPTNSGAARISASTIFRVSATGSCAVWVS